LNNYFQIYLVQRIGRIQQIRFVQYIGRHGGLILKRQRRGETDNKFFMALGKRINTLIVAKGYKSAYAFWLENGEEGLSRSNLNYLLNGRCDPKLSTLIRVAEGLEVELSEILRGL
jgi:transcriptional regulator with XRE-family HTH domain